MLFASLPLAAFLIIPTNCYDTSFYPLLILGNGPHRAEKAHNEAGLIKAKCSPSRRAECVSFIHKNTTTAAAAAANNEIPSLFFYLALVEIIDFGHEG